MHFGLTEEQRMMQDMAKNFAEKEILPHREDDEANHRFRPDLLKKMGELSFFGCAVDEEYGGNGFGFLESVILTEQIGHCFQHRPAFDQVEKLIRNFLR